jgi:hypothetical protein
MILIVIIKERKKEINKKMNNNQNFNYKLAQAEALLQQILTDLPVGVAYYLLNAKTQELKKLYYEQAEREMAAAA